MNSFGRAINWLVGQWQWPYAGLFAAIFLLALVPVWWELAGPALTLVFVQLPVYMIHQYEEHAHDRFRLWVNKNVAGGREALTPGATFVVNSVFVWVVDVAALYLAWFVDIGWGLIAVYLPLVNGFIHIAGGIATRSYNPGLWTSIVLFLPIGTAALCVISPRANWTLQFVGLAVAILIHAGLVVYVKSRVRTLSAQTSQP